MYVVIYLQSWRDCSQSEAAYQVHDDEQTRQQSRSSLFGWLKKDDKVLNVDFVRCMIAKEVLV